MKIIFVIGARPNIVKAAPLIKLASHLKDIEFKLVHTGQHYQATMSQALLTDFDLPIPDINLHTGSGTHATQVSSVMTRFESYCLDYQPDLVVVFGDVNSTLGCALTVSKLPGIKLAHVEAGCRVFDHSPEEINRILVDKLSDYLFCPTETDLTYALRDGVPLSNCYVVGDIAVDALLIMLPKIKQKFLYQDYAIFTLHRPVNVDDKYMLYHLLNIANEIAKQIKVIFPVHPRTLDRLNRFHLICSAPNLDPCPPLGYLQFMRLLNGAKFLLTDSGGLQVDAHFLKTPCLTLNSATGHINTVKCNANTLVGTNFHSVLSAARKILSHPAQEILDGDFWDGHVADRIIKSLTSVIL